MRKTAVLNQKGGVGKTGEVAGTAGALVNRGRRVLAIDFDPQGHLTTEALQLDEVDPRNPNLADALTGDYTGPVRDLIVTHTMHPSGGRLDVLPTTLTMFLVAKKLYLGRSQEWRLTQLLDRLTEELRSDDQYDHVLIDCPPALDVLTDNALAAADGVLIPVQPAKTSIRALRLLMGQIVALEHELRLTKRDLLGLVPSLYRRPLSGLARYVWGQLEQLNGLPIVAELPLSVSVEEAWLKGVPFPLFQPNTELAHNYERLAILLDVAAGISPDSEWTALSPVTRMTELEAAQ